MEIFDMLLAATSRFRELNLQREEYVCLKAMILLNSSEFHLLLPPPASCRCVFASYITLISVSLCFVVSLELQSGAKWVNDSCQSSGTARESRMVEGNIYTFITLLYLKHLCQVITLNVNNYSYRTLLLLFSYRVN